jgi:hypothetical protein
MKILVILAVVLGDTVCLDFNDEEHQLFMLLGVVAMRILKLHDTFFSIIVME